MAASQEEVMAVEAPAAAKGIRKRKRADVEVEGQRRINTPVERPHKTRLDLHVPPVFPVEHMSIISAIIARRPVQKASILEAKARAFHVKQQWVNTAERSKGDKQARVMVADSKTDAISDNAVMRQLYIARLFPHCGACGVRHYMRADYDCSQHLHDAMCNALCTTCGVKHRYPNMKTNSMDRRCTDNVFEWVDVGGVTERDIRGVFCTTCKFTVWEVPGVAFECLGCQRSVEYNETTKRYHFISSEDEPDRKRVRKGIPSPAVAPGSPASSASGCLPMSPGPEPFSPAPASGDSWQMPEEMEFDASPMLPEPRAWSPPPGEFVPTLLSLHETSSNAQRTIAKLEALTTAKVQAIQLGDTDLYKALVKEEVRQILSDIANDTPDGLEGVIRDLLGDPSERPGPVFRGTPPAGATRGPGIRGVRGAGGASDEAVSLKRVMDSVSDALRLRELLEVAQNQEDVDGSVEVAVENEIEELLERLPLMFVEDGFAGVSAACLRKPKDEKEWRRHNEAPELVRGDDWLGLSVQNNGNRPIVAHCVDKHGKNKAVLELNDKKFLTIEPGTAGENKAETIQEANLRWVSDAVRSAINHIGVFWRYADESQWMCILLPYKVVLALSAPPSS